MLTHISLSCLINPGDYLEGASEAPLRQVVRSKPFQNRPVGGVVVHCRKLDQRLPQLFSYWEVLRRVALELTHLYFILQNQKFGRLGGSGEIMFK